MPKCPYGKDAFETNFLCENLPSQMPIPSHRIHLIPVVNESQSPFLRPIAYRVMPISVSIALGHVSVNAVKATAGGAGPLIAPRV